MHFERGRQSVIARVSAKLFQVFRLFINVPQLLLRFTPAFSRSLPPSRSLAPFLTLLLCVRACLCVRFFFLPPCVFVCVFFGWCGCWLFVCPFSLAKGTLYVAAYFQKKQTKFICSLVCTLSRPVRRWLPRLFLYLPFDTLYARSNKYKTIIRMVLLSLSETTNSQQDRQSEQLPPFGVSQLLLLLRRRFVITSFRIDSSK